MAKIRKGKKILLILLIVLAVIVVTLLVIRILPKPEEPEEPTYKNEVIPLPETVYSNMQVKNIQMEYLQDQNKTKVRMTIDNTSTRNVEDEYLDAAFIGADEKILATVTTWIKELDVGKQYQMEVVVPGDQTTATQIKLIEK